MSRRTRRGAALVAVGLAAAVFASNLFAGALAETRREARLDGAWVVVTTQLDPFEEITPAVTEVQRVPAEHVPEAALPPDAASAGWVAATPLPPGTVLQEGSVRPAISTSGRAREVTVHVDSGLQVEPGQLVDVYAGFDRLDGTCLALLAPNTLVVDVLEQQGADLGAAGGRDTVLLSVGKHLVARVVYGSFNGAVRLVSIPLGKTSSAPASTACGVPRPSESALFRATQPPPEGPGAAPRKPLSTNRRSGGRK